MSVLGDGTSLTQHAGDHEEDHRVDEEDDACRSHVREVVDDGAGGREETLWVLEPVVVHPGVVHSAAHHTQGSSCKHVKDNMLHVEWDNFRSESLQTMQELVFFKMYLTL